MEGEGGGGGPVFEKSSAGRFWAKGPGFYVKREGDPFFRRREKEVRFKVKRGGIRFLGEERRRSVFR